MSEVFLLSCIHRISRTLSVAQLASNVIKGAVCESAISPKRPDMFFWGGVEFAGLEDIPLTRIQRSGSGGLQAVWSAAQAVAAGDCDLVLAGGTGFWESPGEENTAVNAALAMVLASTIAVGRDNLPPVSRLVARTLIQLPESPEPSRLARGLQLALQRGGIQLSDVQAIRLDGVPPALCQAWVSALGVDPKLINQSTQETSFDDALSAEGCLHIPRLLAELNSGAGRFGLGIFEPPDHTVMVTLVEKI